MKKRILSCLMALALCLTLLPTAVLAEETEGTAQTFPAVEESTDPANGETKKEGQSAAPEQENQPAEVKQENQPAEAKQENQPAEQEEQQEDSAAKQAVAAVQAMIDALPDAAELDGMDDEDAMAVYEAFQTACEAYYETLNEEQQAQLKNTEKLAALSAWFSQSAALAAGPHSHTLCSHLKNCPDPAHGTTIHNSDVNFDTELTEELLANNSYKLSSGAYYLSSTLSPNKEIKITGTVTICLNGQKIESKGDREYVFLIEHGYTLTLTDCVGTGEVTHASGVIGGGVTVNSGTFNLYGGSITGNTTNYVCGGGVYVYNSGKFNMYGGSITRNKASEEGGGVYVSGANSEFTMRGGEITGNTTAGTGGGVYVYNSGTFNLYGGSITRNEAKAGGNEGKGGGVRVGRYDNAGEFNMYGGEIANNEATDGGGVDVFKGVFTMSGGKITNNTATSAGGGVNVDSDNCTFNMSGGSITGNKASIGGGVYVYSGTGSLNMSGGEIKDNTATGAGGGVYVLFGTLTVSSTAVITGNKKGTADNNVYLLKDKFITVSGHLDNDASIGVTTENAAAGVAIATGTGLNDGDAKKFESDLDGFAVSVKSDGTGLVLVKTHTHYLCGRDTCNGNGHTCHAVTFTAWDSENSLPNAAGNYYLTKDVTLDGSSYIPWMPKPDTVLCLNGHKITMNGNIDVISVPSGVIFTLCDCEGVNSEYGQITHAAGTNGGGVLVKGGTFKMYGGSITKNKTSSGKCGGGVYMDGGTFNLYGGEITNNEAAMGGGVYASGTFEMTGGSITKNKISNGCGGGVFALGTFTMNGGEISGNTVKAATPRESADGGGVYVGTSGTFTMTGGAKIANNTADHNGGGVYVSGQGSFNMTGGTIGGTKSGEANTANYGGGVYADSIGAINMNGGEISGNRALSDGGGVYVYKGTFTIYSGGIAKNTATSAGGGVFARVNGTFTMNGGSIAGGNNAAEGGGVYASGGGTFTMNGGEISGSNATTGGGVYVYGKFNMSSGEIRGNAADESGGGVYVNYNGTFTVSGGVTILENKKNSDANNVYLVSRSNSITIGGRLDDGARIGVTTANEPDEEGITIATNAKSGDETRFVSDAGDLYQISCENGELVLKTSTPITPPVEHTHCLCGETHELFDGHETEARTTFTAWDSENSLPSDVGDYYLTNDVTLDKTWTPANGTVLCLNGHSITVNANTEPGGHQVGAIVVSEGYTFTLVDCKGGKTEYGQITHGTNTETGKKYTGRGVCVYGTFNMYGGNITGNELTQEWYCGGGVSVYAAAGIFNLYGGSITNNKSNNTSTGSPCGEGGGVYTIGKFTMYDGTISGNEAYRDGGGVYTVGANGFTMYGGNITGNTARGQYYKDWYIGGGGVFVDSGNRDDAGIRFTMKGGTISNNTAYGAGGGVYVQDFYGSFVMEGGTISGNRAVVEDSKSYYAGKGGGVYVSDCSFTMENGSITGNTAEKAGGGVYASGKFTMRGGIIGGTEESDANTAGENGGGVYVDNGTPGGYCKMSGDVKIIGNKKSDDSTNNNYYGRLITIDNGNLGDNAKIGVNLGSNWPTRGSIRIVTDAVGTADADKFFSDKEGYEIKYYEYNNSLNVAKADTTGTTHTHYLCGGKTACNEAGGHTCEATTFATKLWMDNGVLKKGNGDWTKGTVNRADGGAVSHEGYVLTTGSYYLENDLTLSGAAILIDGDVKLCLNGHTIDRANGNAPSDYVIWVLGENEAHLTLTDCMGGGTIKGGGNGGVDIFGFCTLDMFGGTITGNTNRGVGVGQFGVFNMYGGEITGNSAGFGGVYNGGTVNMYGGEIRDNMASNKGGGVYMEASVGNYQGGILNVSGAAKITDNTVKGVANNVYLPSGKTIAIGTGGLSGTIGVTTEPKPAAGTPVTVIAATKGISGLTTHVVSDDNAYATAVEGSAIVLKVVGDTTGGNIPVTQITLDTTTASLEVGKTTTLTATVEPSDATNKSVTWTSSDTSVATVAPDGTVTAVKAGTATISATAEGDNSKFATCTVTVTGGTTPSQPGGSTGGNTGGSSSGGGGGSSSGGSDSNPIIKTETKNNADGSTTKTETRRDGSVTQTTTGKDGSVSKTETKPNGSSVTENKAADGSTGTVKTDKNGQTTAETKVSAKAVEDAKKNGEAVKAPVEVKASHDSSTAPTVKVELPKGAGETKVEIPVSNVKSGTVAVLVHPDGTEEIVKNSIPTEDGIQLTVDGSATVKIVDNSKGFIDTRNHWAEDEIDFVSARGLVNGMTDTIYAPNNSTTRAQLWTILARQNDADLSGGSVWYEKAQNWAKSEGVSDGANPNAAINRAQMVTMLWRAVGQPAAGVTANFTDVSADSYYAQAVAWAIENGITTGVGGGKFDPTGACTRAQIAAFLARLYAEK